MTRDLFGEVPAPVVAAYGGGVDSTAMLIGMVQRGERVDAALFADTGSEKPQTYAYVELFRAWLDQHGIPLHTVRYEPQNFKHYPPYRTLAENCFTNGTLPSISFGRHSCSQKWKVAPQDKWCERWEPAIRCWSAGGKVTKLIGYDAGPRDSKRYAHSEGHQDARYDYRCPLQEWGWDRERCEAEIAAAGLPVPVKSACYMCGAMKPWEMDLLPPPPAPPYRPNGGARRAQAAQRRGPLAQDGEGPPGSDGAAGIDDGIHSPARPAAGGGGGPHLAPGPRSLGALPGVPGGRAAARSEGLVGLAWPAGRNSWRAVRRGRRRAVPGGGAIGACDCQCGRIRKHCVDRTPAAQPPRS